jgi:hypothetical protein
LGYPALLILLEGCIGIICAVHISEKVISLQSEHPDNQLPVIAKWEHILKLYELDKPRPFRQLYKLTDTHLNPTAHSAMKVSVVSQIMRHFIILAILFCSVLNLRKCIHFRFSRFSVFLKLFYYSYFGHIIFNIKLGNMNMFQDYEVCQRFAIILLLFIYY